MTPQDTEKALDDGEMTNNNEAQAIIIIGMLTRNVSTKEYVRRDQIAQMLQHKFPTSRLGLFQAINTGPLWDYLQQTDRFSYWSRAMQSDSLEWLAKATVSIVQRDLILSWKPSIDGSSYDWSDHDYPWIEIDEQGARRS